MIHGPDDLEAAIAAYELGERFRKGLPFGAHERRPGSNRRGLRGFGAAPAAQSLLTLPATALIGAWEARAAGNTLDVNGDLEVAADLSGAGNHLTSVGGLGSRITLAASASFGGQVVGTLGTAGYYITRATFVGGALTQPTTQYAVAKSSVSVAATAFLHDSGGATPRQFVYIANASPDQWAIGALTGVNLGDSSTSAIILCAVFNGASSAGYVDDMATAAASGNAGTGGLNGFTVGASYAGASYVPAGDLWAASYVYDAAHDATERAAVAAYIAQEFGL